MSVVPAAGTRGSINAFDVAFFLMQIHDYLHFMLSSTRFIAGKVFKYMVAFVSL